jgi:hypothetical protein
MRWLLALLLLPVLVVPAEPAAAATPEWAAAGPFTHVYDPGTAGGVQQYVNDHTFFRGPDGTWHLYGITGNAQPDGTVPDSDLERTFLHATAPSLTGPWTTRAPALTYDPSYGETHLWAPYVMTDGSGTYYMFYAGGGDPTQAEINLATSTDLYHWTRSPGGPLFHDGFEARDPYVTRIGDEWVMYYEATSAATGGNYVVAYRTSTDLVHWSGRSTAFTDPTSGTGAGNTESPFVVQHDGLWYLFLGPRGGYSGTDVFRSDDPFSFSTSGSAGHIWSHAAEVVQDGSSWYVSAAGWWQHGVSLAPLTWSTTAPPTVAATDDFPDGHGNPVVGRQQNGAMVVFAIAPDYSSISYRAQTAPSSGWGPWTRLGGPVGGLPVVASDPDGRLELAQARIS